MLMMRIVKLQKSASLSCKKVLLHPSVISEKLGVKNSVPVPTFIFTCPRKNSCVGKEKKLLPNIESETELDIEIQLFIFEDIFNLTSIIKVVFHTWLHINSQLRNKIILNTNRCIC